MKDVQWNKRNKCVQYDALKTGPKELFDSQDGRYGFIRVVVVKVGIG